MLSPSGSESKHNSRRNTCNVSVPHVVHSRISASGRREQRIQPVHLAANRNVARHTIIKAPSGAKGKSVIRLEEILGVASKVLRRYMAETDQESSKRRKPAERQRE